MKYLNNGAIGTLTTKNNGMFSSAIIVEANSTYIEFQDSGGTRYILAYPEFNGWDYASQGSPLNALVRSGATLKQGSTTVGTLRGYKNGYIEYEDTLGNGHSYNSPLFFTIL